MFPREIRRFDESDQLRVQTAQIVVYASAYYVNVIVVLEGCQSLRSAYKHMVGSEKKVADGVHATQFTVGSWQYWPGADPALLVVEVQGPLTF